MASAGEKSRAVGHIPGFQIDPKEAIMKKVVSCAFNIDTTSVEVKCADTCK